MQLLDQSLLKLYGAKVWGKRLFVNEICEENSKLDHMEFNYKKKLVMKRTLFMSPLKSDVTEHDTRVLCRKFTLQRHLQNYIQANEKES